MGVGSVKNGESSIGRNLSRTNYIVDYRGHPRSDGSLTIWKFLPGSAKLVGQGEYKDPFMSETVKVTSSGFPLALSTPFQLAWPQSPPSGWHLDLVSGTNPSRPVITPLTMIQNLVELPKMIMELGRFLKNPRAQMTPRGIADAHLAIRFGWMPLIDDLKKLLELQTYIDKRMAELSKLYSGQGLRRRLRFSNDTQSSSSSETIALFGLSWIVANSSTKVERESWGTIYWHPTTPPPYRKGDSSKIDFTRRLVLGMTREGLAKGSWDVIPWTWLLGWFTNVGKYLTAHSNTVPAMHSKACFMSKAKITMSAEPTSLSSTFREGSKLDTVGMTTLEIKTRTVASGSPTVGFQMPFLDIHRLSILGSLGIQRLRR